ncbi:glycoside hydrolase family 99-like domain-containing protein [candidate division KSB1 bacterium]|nr:glycoside hydrolase family 99-like domain-containing protein [candidate division KSB1 bacterium]
MRKILFVLLMFFTVSSPADTIIGYYFHITLSTTSDWCAVSIKNADLLVLDYEVLIDESPNSQIHSLAINQPGKTSLISVKYIAFLIGDNYELPDKLIAETTKGDWGNVRVLVQGFKNGNLAELLDFSNNGSIPGDPTNSRTFEIPRSEILETDTAEIETVPADAEKKLFAFYYPWYGSPDGPNGAWFHWEPNNQYASTHEPLLGYYDSGSPELQQQHLAWAREAGVDVFICSWWGKDSYEDHRLVEFLDQAENSPVKLSIYFETNSEIENADQAQRPTVVKKHLRYVLDQYGAHPAFFKYEGKPVIFLYGLPLSRMPLEDWQGVLEDLRGVGYSFFVSVDSYNALAVKIFDGFHTYNPLYHTQEELTSIFTTNLVLSHYHHKVFAGTILPGYDDTVIRTPGTVVEREGGRFYQMQWEVVKQINPPWVLITSWNEWHEGSEIEPSMDFGKQYINLTKDGDDGWNPGGGVKSNIYEPVSFQLLPAFPNPFNGNVRVIFTLPHHSDVRVDVFDTLGRKIKSLMNEQKNSGIFTATWDGCDENGNKVASGLYLIRVQAGKQTAIEKTIFLK